jgi:putative FmdB family regulatory protein
MPTYDYVCDACDHTFDEFQHMSDEPLKKCPKCGKKKLRRLFGSGAAIIFKGSGFYETDYRSDSYKKGAEADASQAKQASESGDKSGKDSTPAPAPKATGGKEGGSSGKKAK